MFMAVLRTINELFREKGKNFLEKHSRYGIDTSKIVQSISQCRTAALGGRVEECKNCGHRVILYNSCRNRHCPQCQSLKKEKWIEEKKNELFPFPYYHAVFTLPEKLNAVTYRNKKIIYSLLFDSVKKSLLSMMDEEKYFGARIGFFAILHTWGQRLNLHPHLHCVVPGGGYSIHKGKWLSCKPEWLIPVKALSKRFRSKFLVSLKRYYKKEELYLKNSGFEKPKEFYGLIDELFKQPWVVYIKETFKHTVRVIQYLGRYTHRIAISNYRIKKIDKDTITYKYKDYRNGNQLKYETVSHEGFMRRFLLHTLPNRFVRIRYYGLYAHRNKKKKITESRAALNAERLSEKNEESWQDVYLRVMGLEADLCPKCGKGRLVEVEFIKQNNKSPPKYDIT